jgi:hypothetical protein
VYIKYLNALERNNLSKEQHKPASYLVMTGLLGWLFSSSVIGVNLWAALLVLRRYDVIDKIVPYQGCFALAALFVSAVIYLKTIVFGK